jgi:hypothetical protein
VTALTFSQPTTTLPRRLTELIHYMPWLKVSDKLAMHLRLLSIRRTPKADERSVNEVTGWITRCATYSAGYLTDYYLDLEVAEQFGLSRTDTLLAQAVAAGLLIPEGRGRNKRWKIVQDDEMFHIRMQVDVAADRQRDADRRNPDLKMPALARDGDQCRYCRVVTTSSKDTQSGRGQTFDHTEPGRPARIDTYVVACRSCNSRLKDRPRPVEGLPLLPPPPVPHFSPALTSRQDVERYLGRTVASASEAFHEAHLAATPPTPTRGAAAAGAPSRTGDAAAAGARPGTAEDLAAAGATPAATGGAAAAGAPSDPWSGSPPDQNDRPPWSQGGSRDGPGRGGSGREGQGSAVPSPPLPASDVRSRGARGRRGRGGETR